MGAAEGRGSAVFFSWMCGLCFCTRGGLGGAREEGRRGRTRRPGAFLDLEGIFGDEMR